MEEVVIVSAVRTAIGGFGGALKGRSWNSELSPSVRQ